MNMRKKIMIFNVPAQELGALTILNNAYKAALDDHNDYIFIISGDYLKKADNIDVVSLPWVKKSWFHRLFFDYFISMKLIKKYKADEVISYQNMTVRAPKNIKQKVYLHNAIPFTDINFSLKKETKLWIYKKIISKKILHSLKKADQIIVQTNWMKSSVLKKINSIDSHQVVVENTSELISNLIGKDHMYIEDEFINKYIYPAAPFVYKNHLEIVEACKQLTEQEKKKVEIVFTFEGNESENAKKIKQEIIQNHLPIFLIGKITPKEVQQYYLTHQLLFSSKLETLGLPLLEAQMFNTPIIYRKSVLFDEVTNSYNNEKSYRTIVGLKKILIKF